MAMKVKNRSLQDDVKGYAPRALIAVAAIAALAGCHSSPNPTPAEIVTQWIWMGLVVLTAIVLVAAVIWFLKYLYDHLGITTDTTSETDAGYVMPKRGNRVRPTEASLDALCRMTRSRDAALRAEAALEMSRRLPHVANEAFLLYDQPTRHKMYRALEGQDTEAACAMLDLIRRCKDQAARPHIERLIARLSRRDQPSRLGEEARTCLDVLRASAQATGAALLRPTTSTGEDRLLRYTERSPTEQPELLLRAHEE